MKRSPAWADVAAACIRRLPFGRSHALQWFCRKSQARFLGRMPRELGGHLFDCSLQDMIARQVFFCGCYAAQEIAVLRSALKPGMTFLDVGAHWGFFSLTARALVGSAGRIIALEPNPEAYSKLVFNFNVNDIANAAVFELAAADRDGHVHLTESSSGMGAWDFSRVVDPGSEGRTVIVTSRPLDGLMSELGVEAVDLVKIDVEGAEATVLEGMEEGLNRQLYRRILLEIHPLHLRERGLTAGNLLRLLASKGYRGYGIDCRGKAMREAFYRPWGSFERFVTSLEMVENDENPHTLWVSSDAADLGQ